MHSHLPRRLRPPPAGRTLVRVPSAPARLRPLLRRADFRRLLATRLSSQLGDGVFQAALAGTVLFNPQRAAAPLDVAAGFAVLLLPYSVVGPFAGVWLDRWSRRQVLVLANVVRALLVTGVAALTLAGVQGTLLYVAGLAVFSVTRFVLSALSAALPHTTGPGELVAANALTTTAGAMAGVVGGAIGIGAAGLLPIDGDARYAVVTVLAALPYLAGARAAAGFSRGHLGPDDDLPVESARDALLGLADGARYLAGHPQAVAALAVIGVHRLVFGVLTLMTLLLYRTTYDGAGPLFPGGLAGLGPLLAVGAAGALLAAAVTPPVVRRTGRRRWVVALLVLGGFGQLAAGLPFAEPATVVAGFLLGFVGQGIKICVDSTLQEVVDDDHRGRVFSLYDALFNIAFVLALVAAALLLPPSGVSPGVLAAVSAAYLLTAAAGARASR